MLFAATYRNKSMYSQINLERLKSDANTPQALQNVLSNFTWKRSNGGYRAKEHGGHSIYCKGGQWLFASHNGDYKGGNVLAVVSDVHNLDLKTKEGLFEAANIVCQAANLDFSKYCTDAPSEALPKYTPSVKIETKAFLPNAGHEEIKNFDFELATPDSYTYKAAQKFYDKKNGSKVVAFQSITHIATGKKTVFNHKKIGIGYFSNGFAGNIKVKIIDLTTGKKQMFTIQNAGNYVFGLESLPSDRKDFTLLLCAGEDDTNAINTHLQPFGFCALTFGSESATIPTDYLTHLQTKFKAVFCLLDSDKTGVKMAIRNATANGLPYIAIGDHYPPSVKDVCDIYKQFGHSELLKLVKVQTTIKAAQKTDFERISYNLHSVLNLNINQYLSEKLDRLKAFISIYPKLLLQSPTDTGKTTAIVELSKDPNFYKELGIDSIILAVPRLFLCEQLKEVFEQKTGVIPSVIDGTAQSIDIQEAYQSKVIICTYDSLRKLENHLQYSLLVIDEMHLLTDDTAFRSDVTAKVFDLMPKAKRVLGLTATPNFEMCVGMQLNEKYVPNEIRESLNFTLCKVSLTKEQSKKLQLKAYSESRINAVTVYASQAAQGNKTAILLNDVKVLETVSQIINEKYGEATATILSSKKPAYNVENPTYNAIVKGEAVPTENRVFLGTNILTAGVSLNFAVENLGIFGNLDSRTITQFAARPRLQGEVNKALNVDLFKTMTKAEFETVLSDFEQSNIETPESLKDKKNALESFESAISAAVTLCEAANNLPNKSEGTRRKAFDELGFIFYDESTDQFKPNLTSILYNHNQRLEKRLTMYGRLWKARQYDPTFEILPPQWCDFAECKEAAEVLGEKKEAAKIDKETAFEVFTGDVKTCLEIVFKQTFDVELRNAIKTEIAPQRELSEAAIRIIRQYPSVTDGTLIEVAGRYFDLKETCFGVSEITKKDALLLLKNTPKRSDYQLLKNRIISLSELRSLDNGTSTNAEKLRALNSKRIIKTMQAFENSKRRSWLTAGELIKLVSTSKRCVEMKEAKMRISELFEVNTDRKELNGKRVVVYEIGDRLTLKSVIENAIIEPKSDPKNAEDLGQKRGKILRIEKQHKTLINS